MHILLDLDGTVFVGGKLHPRFREFQASVRHNNHTVMVWSSHDEGHAISALMGFSYLHKDSLDKPNADILIDDCCEAFGKLCSIHSEYSSLDDFLDDERKEVDVDTYDYRQDILTAALEEIARMGANPITKYGCQSRLDFMRHAEQMWQIAWNALKRE